MQFLYTANKNLLMGCAAAATAFGLWTFISTCVFVSQDFLDLDRYPKAPHNLGVDGRSSFIFVVFSLINLFHWAYQTFSAFKFQYDAEKHTYFKTSTSFILMLNWFIQMLIAGQWVRANTFILTAYTGDDDGDIPKDVYNTTMSSSGDATIAGYSLGLICGIAYLVFFCLWKAQLLSGQNNNVDNMAQQPQADGYQPQVVGYQPQQESPYYAAPTQQPNYEAPAQGGYQNAGVYQ